MRKQNHWGFTISMISKFSSLVSNICDTYEAGAFWAELSRDDISQLSLTIDLSKEIRAEIRCTAMPEWFRVECGPVNARADYTREGAEHLDDALFEIERWIRNYFDDPESVDKQHLPQPFLPFGCGLLWPVEGIQLRVPPGQPNIENAAVH